MPWDSGYTPDFDGREITRRDPALAVPFEFALIESVNNDQDHGCAYVQHPIAMHNRSIRPQHGCPQESVCGNIIASPQRSVSALLYVMGFYIPNCMPEWVYFRQRRIGWRYPTKVHRKMPVFMCISVIFCEPGGLCRLPGRRLVALFAVCL